MRPRLPLVVGLLLALPCPLLAQTTGRIVGQAQNDLGQPAPGATVTVTSASLQGARSAVTDAHGVFHIPFLPPGAYHLRAELAGFKTVQVVGVRVEMDHAATVQIRMEVASLSETLDVIATASEIDVTNGATGVNVGAELFTRIPLDRSFYATARLAPGTQEDETGTAFHGSTGLENQYVIDGLNVTGTGAGAKGGKDLNFDFVEEVEVKSGGLPAEYGRTTGGILNVLTKSGSNEFHGSAFGFYAGSGLRSDNRTAAQRPADTTTVDDTTSRWDFGAQLGGRIVRDRLWFFAAYNRVADDAATTVVRDLESPGAPAVGAIVPNETRESRFAAKLTWHAAASSTLTASAFGNPHHFTGPVTGINGPPSTYLGTSDGQGTTDFTLRYEGTFGSSLLVRALYGQHHQGSTFGGPGTETPRLDDQTVSPTASSGGIGWYGDGSARRDVYKLDASKFVHGHELKIGGDFEDLRGEDWEYVSGGDYVTKLASSDVVYYNHAAYLDDRAPGFDRDDPTTWRPANPAYSAPRTRNVSAYVQDAWQIRKGLTLNLGLRFEQQRLEDRDGKTPLAVDNWAPRLGVAWDVNRDGRSKLHASYGRYFENIPQLIQYVAFGGVIWASSYNLDPTPGALAPDSTAPQFSAVYGGSSTDVAPGIKGQFLDEWLVGYDRELRADIVVAISGRWRRLGRVIEDLNAGNGEYLFGNPGEGAASTLAFFDGSSAPSPRARRDNYSLEASARKRFSRGWQLLASYVFSRLEGNYDGSYQRSTGQGTPNYNSGFDYADFMVNADGPLTSEGVHQLKLDGSYELKSGLNFGLSTHWYSGWPENAYGLSFNYSSPQYFLVPRGSVGRNPADYEIDLHASYPIRLGKTARLQLQADVFNLLDRQALLSYDQRYNLFPDGPCGGIPAELCNGDGGLATRPGTLEPLGAIADPRQTATNPDYLKKGTIFTSPRSLRLGVRVIF
jgi:hypothetical protein